MPRKHRRRRPTYTLLDVLQASATQPLPQAKRTHQLTRMWQGLPALGHKAHETCAVAVRLIPIGG